MIYSCNNVVHGEHVDRAGQELGVSLKHQIATNRILSQIFLTKPLVDPVRKEQHVKLVAM